MSNPRAPASGAPPCDAVKIKTVFLHATRACNLRCNYCYFSAAKPQPDEMSSDEFERFWPELVAIEPDKVVFTGGEPLLRRDIVDLLIGLRKSDPEHRVLRCLNSNGHGVTRDLAQELVGLVDEVRVSIDALMQRNDALRGKGNFASAIRALEVYRAVGFEPKALITVTAVSLPDLHALLDLLIGIGVGRININRFRSLGRGAETRELRVSAADYRSAVGKAIERVSSQSRLSIVDTVEQEHCGVGRFLNILPNGDVYPCHVLTLPEFRCGNIRDERLTAICRRNGLLDSLSSLQFGKLVYDEPKVSELKRLGACFADVYRQTSSLKVWSKRIPIIDQRLVR